MELVDYRLDQIERCLKDLTGLIALDTAMLTPDDQRAIERRIADLNTYIRERFFSHGRQGD